MGDVKSARRVIEVFELLSRHPEGMSLSQISQSLRIPPSSCHALLWTLNNLGYIFRDDLALTHRLGTKLFELAGTHVDSLDLIKVADPVMEHMSRVCNESVSFAVLEKTEVVFIHKKTSGGVIRIVNPVGTRLPAHGTGLGKVILAELPPDELDAMYPHAELKRYTPHTITSKQALMRCLAEVREQGVAYDREESAIGVQAVGAVVRDHTGLAIAAISVAVLSTHERDEEYWHRLEEVVKTGANIISARLGYATPSGSQDLSQIEMAWQGSSTASTE